MARCELVHWQAVILLSVLEHSIAARENKVDNLR